MGKKTQRPVPDGGQKFPFGFGQSIGFGRRKDTSGRDGAHNFSGNAIPFNATMNWTGQHGHPNNPGDSRTDPSRWRDSFQIF